MIHQTIIAHGNGIAAFRRHLPLWKDHPWTLDRRSLFLMLRASRKWPDVTEDGYADRYFAALAHLANVPILPHSPLGFARATITEDDISELRKAIYAGSTMIHGIKQKWTLEAALQFYDERPKPNTP